MNILSAGVHWRTPIWLRERLSLSNEQAIDELRRWHGQFPASELAILSTCNRTELVLLIPEHSSISRDEFQHNMTNWFCTRAQLSTEQFDEHLIWRTDSEAARHLFEVASGIDSLILGESQILGQVRHAYQLACDAQVAGKGMHTLFQRAIAVAKRVQTETELSRGRLSIASGAIEFLTGVFSNFTDKTVLVIGAGKMAELTLTHLMDLEPKQVLTTNRTFEKAAHLAGKFAGEARAWEELTQSLVDADIIISSTGAQEPIVSAAEFAGVMQRREQRLIAIIDIALPRDFAPEIAKLDNVLLWNIDDLEAVRNRTLSARAGELDRARRIIDVELENFLVAVHLQRSGPALGELERVYDELIKQELDWLIPQLNGMPEESQQKIKQFAHRLKNKFLHMPRTALREDAKQGSNAGLLNAFRKLFALEK